MRLNVVFRENTKCYHIFILHETINTCNNDGIRTYIHYVRKRTLNHLAKLIKCLSCAVSTYLYGAFHNIQSNAPYRQMLNHLVSLTKYLSVHLRTKWLWVRIPLLSLKFQIWRLLRARTSLTFRKAIKCSFTLKLVRKMITYIK